MTILYVSRHLKLGWNIIKSIQKKYARPNFNELERIDIAEIYVGKRGCLTVILVGGVVFVEDGKGGNALPTTID